MPPKKASENAAVANHTVTQPDVYFGIGLTVVQQYAERARTTLQAFLDAAGDGEAPYLVVAGQARRLGWPACCGRSRGRWRAQ